jgi:hypothetical protein
MIKCNTFIKRGEKILWKLRNITLDQRRIITNI